MRIRSRNRLMYRSDVQLPYSVSPERRVDLVPSRSCSFPNTDELREREMDSYRKGRMNGIRSLETMSVHENWHERLVRSEDAG